MIIVIDAYNLLRTIPPYKKTINEKERAQFIAQLSSYGRHKGHKIIIVFDGGSHEWPFVEHMKVVQIVYSGMHESADDYIKEYIEKHKAKDMLLVSSDTELNRHAQYHNIPSIDSITFAGILYEQVKTKKIDAVKQPNEVVKLVQDKELSINAQDSLDALMIKASKNVAEKSEDFARDRATKKDKLTKQERMLLQKLKKL